MRIEDLLESIKNPRKYWIGDMLAGISDVARGIRQEKE